MPGPSAANVTGLLAAWRGGDASHVALDETILPARDCAADPVALDDALEELAALAPRETLVVELRDFAGVSVEETAQALGASADTVMRNWRMAELWLRCELFATDRARLGDTP